MGTGSTGGLANSSDVDAAFYTGRDMTEVVFDLASSNGAENEWPHPAYLHVVTEAKLADMLCPDTDSSGVFECASRRLHGWLCPAVVHEYGLSLVM